MKTLFRVGVAFALALFLGAAGLAGFVEGKLQEYGDSSSTTSPTSDSADGIVDELPERPGYDRSCSPGDGCVFGPSWSDDTDARWSHNGCDTRSDVLREQLRDVTLKPGTNGCVVAAGTLVEPYTGQTISYRRSDQPATVHVDHVIALSWAWDAGAADWPLERRATFANDPANLLAASAATNQSKSDQGPAEWASQIKDTDRRCRFLRTAHKVIHTYGLTITQADAAAFNRCGLKETR